MADVKTYDPTLYTLIVAAIPIDKGFADGEFVKLVREGELFSDYAGTDGSVTRAKKHDKRATFTLRLAQSADANALLSALALLDENADNGAGVGPFLMKDRGGTTLHAAAACWIRKRPDVTLDKDVTVREWEIRIAKLKSFDGGN